MKPTSITFLCRLVERRGVFLSVRLGVVNAADVKPPKQRRLMQNTPRTVLINRWFYTILLHSRLLYTSVIAANCITDCKKFRVEQIKLKLFSERFFYPSLEIHSPIKRHSADFPSSYFQ